MRRRTGKIRRLVGLDVLFAVAVAACSAPAESPQTPPPTATPQVTASSLECEAQGYPCSLGEVPPNILAESDALGDQVRERLEAGSSPADAETWLKTQPRVAEVEADDMAVRFRLEGGRGVWVLRKEALAQNVGGVPSSSAATTTRASPATAQSREAVAFERQSDSPPRRGDSSASLYRIVGGESAQKRALVLSPMLHDFGNADDGAAVAATLASTRGYENGVTYLANPASDSTNVGVENFKGWRDYQVIHVVSHGARLCKKAPCRAVIVAQELTGSAGSGQRPQRALELEAAGGELCKAAGGRAFLCLGADFFRHEYPGGLDNTVVFFNGCETFGDQATDLGDAIRGGTSVYLGWSERVSSQGAQAAALKLYAELSGKGVPVGSAYDDLDGLEHDKSGTAVLTVGKRRAGGDLRIRNVVWLRHPDTKAILSSSDEVKIDGTPSDGENDAAPYLVQVDGLTADEASGVLLHVSADGKEADPKPVSTGAENADGQWMVDGEVPLGYDVTAAKPVTYRAWIELPSGGQSESNVAATLTGRSPSWEGDATFLSGVSFQGDLRATATAHLTFELMPGQEPDTKRPIYVVTSGTMTWSKSGGYAGCTYLGGPVTIPLDASNTGLEIGTDGTMVGSFLQFDLTKTPVEYTGAVKPQVTDVTVTRTCSDPDLSGTYLDPSVAVFLRADLDAHWTVSNDTIAGTYHIDRQNPSGWYESDWSFRRK